MSKKGTADTRPECPGKRRLLAFSGILLAGFAVATVAAAAASTGDRDVTRKPGALTQGVDRAPSVVPEVTFAIDGKMTSPLLVATEWPSSATGAVRSYVDDPTFPKPASGGADVRVEFTTSSKPMTLSVSVFTALSAAGTPIGDIPLVATDCSVLDPSKPCDLIRTDAGWSYTVPVSLRHLGVSLLVVQAEWAPPDDAELPVARASWALQVDGGV